MLRQGSFLFRPQGSILFRPKGSVPRARRGQTHAPFPEVQDISSLDKDDIIKDDIIKDPAMTKIFAPRLGGIVLITTKSKKFLTPLLNDYNKLTEEQKQQRIPGQLLIR